MNFIVLKLVQKNIIDCYDEIPEGYYLDLNNKAYKKCYENCLFCYGEGNETINNCKECITNFTLINNINCYKECEYYYYFDELDKYQCTSSYNCPNNYIKLIEEQNRCIDKCKNDNIYKYEYNDICYTKCPNGTYLLEDDNDNLCYDKNPDSYYFDKDNNIYKKCYETCYKCD